MEKLMSAKDVAALFGVSVDTIHRLAHKKGGLKGYKVGGSTRFRPSDVEEYINSQEIKPPEKQTPFPGMKRFKYVPGMKVVSL